MCAVRCCAYLMTRLNISAAIVDALLYKHVAYSMLRKVI
ncbi:MAG: hypothetical protein RLZZ196_2259 [Bacteroidota bacterium]|jgi:hypothetical protein